MNFNYQQNKEKKGKKRNIHTVELIHRCEMSKKTRAKASFSAYGGSFDHYRMDMLNQGFVSVRLIN